MAECRCAARLRVEGRQELALAVGDHGGHRWGSTEYVPMVTTDLPEYAGPYEADARFSDQVFATAGTAMAADFSVHAINYTEAPNDSGITVTIGG